MNYPETRKDDRVSDFYFGKEVKDPYRWLEDDRSEETAAWVRSQNEVTNKYLSNIPFREKIRQRYEQLFNYEKYSLPFRYGGYTYYYRNSGLQNQSVLYRESKAGVAEVFLDPNTFSADGTSSLAGVYFTKDGSRVAYMISAGGTDWQTLHIRDAASGTVMEEQLQVKFTGASWKGNDGFFYSTYAREAGTSELSGLTFNHKLFYHRVGTPQVSDELVYGSDEQPTRYISSQVTEDERWLVVYLANETYGNAVLVKDLSDPKNEFVTIVADMKNQHTVVDTDGSFFYIQTDRNAPTGKLVRVPLQQPAEANWETLIPARPETLECSSAGGYFFCSYLQHAVSYVEQFDRDGRLVRVVDLPGPGSAMGFDARLEDKDLFYGFASYTQPFTVYRMDIADGLSSVYKSSAIRFDPSRYSSTQVFYTSSDGTRIPMIITARKDVVPDGSNPCLLYGYGGFGVSLTPSFSVSNLLLLENGGIYAVANLRGGGEYGAQWHQQGIGMKKQQVFDDFLAAMDYLVAEGYTNRERLAIAGGSNGGLLVGACITQQPDCCKVAFPAVGVLDMLRYHRFTAGAGWAYDYGTAEQSEEMFSYLYGYSPLHNVRDANYPAVLITTADHDDRVVPAHSFKFAATLQAHQRGPNPVLIRINVNAGHGAGMSTAQIIAEQTDKWAFFFYNMGLNFRPAAG